MSKYIRTKDGVYEVVDTYEVKYVIGYTEDGFEISIYKDQVIKQFDNLSELCDTYVFVGEDKDCYGNPLLWNIKQDIPFLMKYYYEQNNIYGAIWSDKGLIYVAKLVDGKLVLI